MEGKEAGELAAFGKGSEEEGAREGTRLRTECLSPRPPNSCAEALTPKAMVLGGGAFGSNWV